MDSQNRTESVSSSLLDILIKSEEPSDEPDPLEAIGNIGDEVIVQLSGAMDSGQDLMQNALKMFDDVMAYSKKPSVAKKQTRHQKTGSPLPLPPSYSESSSKKFHKSDMKAGYSPRTKFDSSSSCSELFQHGQIPDARFQVLHDKLEKERCQQFEDLIKNDVERLLSSASKIYGPREWTVEEKTEFANYCRNLRSGSLSDEDKASLQNFYTKAYQESLDQESVKDMLAEKSTEQDQLKLLKKEEMMDVKQKTFEQDMEEMPQLTAPSFLFESALDPAQIGNFDPGMKYEKEKEFRAAANNIFADVMNARIREHHPIPVERLAASVREDALKEDLKTLAKKFSQLMKDEKKKWTAAELMNLKRYLDLFSERMFFTIVQTKDLGMFLRKTFGRLQQYEIERENDTALQEKRKFWQEYKKTHAPVRKEKEPKAPTRAYVKSKAPVNEETFEARRLRKAAYLRKWRLAQKEKQFYSSMLGAALPKPEGSS